MGRAAVTETDSEITAAVDTVPATNHGGRRPADGEPFLLHANMDDVGANPRVIRTPRPLGEFLRFHQVKTPAVTETTEEHFL